MANPTAKVPTEKTPWSEDNVYWPLDSTDTADTIYNGEMIGVRGDNGYAEHFDDTARMWFLGTKEGITQRLQTDSPVSDFKVMAARPKLFSMPLLSGSAGIPDDIGKAAYAADSGHVQLTATTYSNLAGMVVDIGRSGLSSGVMAMSGASAVTLAPPMFGALLGLVVQGFSGKTAGAAPALVVNAGAGGGSTGATTAGAGASVTITSGAGGAAAGSGTGGAAGHINLVPSDGGTSGSGTAGADGAVRINGKGFIPVSIPYNASSADLAGFVAAGSQTYRVTGIILRVTAAGTDGGAVTVAAKKAPSGTALASGTALHASTGNLKGTANTNQTLTLSATASDLLIAAGDTIGLDFTGTLTDATGVVTILLEPLG